MIHLQINEPFEDQVQADQLKNAAQTTLKHQKAADNVDLTIVVSDDAQLQELNRQFLNIDSPTDVLSFPSDESDPDTGNLYLGDIILSLPRAAEQAQTGGHPVAAELQLLVVHGVLHLLGYDHAEPDQKEAMWLAQSEILLALGSPISGPAKD